MPELARISGHKQQGRLHLPAWDIVEGLVAAYPEGTVFELTCTPLVGKRTAQQNKYYWGVVLRMLAKEMGEGEKIIHAYLLDILAPLYIDHQDTVHAPSTANMSTAEFGRYLQAVQQWALNTLQVTIPNPTDDYAL